MSIAYSIGIDYHSRTVQMCILDEKGKKVKNYKVHNDYKEIIDSIERYVPDGYDVNCAVEACNGSTDFAHQLNYAGYKTKQVHAGYTSRMKLNPDKTDYGDAQILAELLHTNYLPLVWTPPEWICHLRTLNRLRGSLSKARKREKQEIRSLLHQYHIYPDRQMSAWTQKWFDWLNNEAIIPSIVRYGIEQHLNNIDSYSTQIIDVESKITTLCQGNATYEKLLTQSQIGVVTAAMLLGEVGDFTRFRTAKQFAKFCGFSPMNSSSGDKQTTAGIIQSGNQILRYMIVEVAHRLVLRDEASRERFQHLVTHGKKPCVAIIAVGNHWLRKLFHEMKNFQLELGHALGNSPNPEIAYDSMHLPLSPDKPSESSSDKILKASKRKSKDVTEKQSFPSTTDKPSESSSDKTLKASKRKTKGVTETENLQSTVPKPFQMLKTKFGFTEGEITNHLTAEQNCS